MQLLFVRTKAIIIQLRKNQKTLLRKKNESCKTRANSPS